MSDLATVDAPATAAPPSLDSLSSTDLATWRQTGQLPSSDTTSTPTADSSPAAPDAQAASTDAPLSPASESGTPKKANAETRKAELKAEIDALLKQREALRRETDSGSRPAAPDVSTASSPVTQPITLDAIVNAPDPHAPLLSDAEFYGQYPDATLSDFTRYVAGHTIARSQMQAERQSTVKTRAESFAKVLTAAIDADPEFWPSVEGVSKALVPLDHLKADAKATALNYAAQEIFESPHGPAILSYLATHPEEFDAIRRSDPRHAIKTIARLEERLAKPPVSPVPVGKTTTSAPPPPITLGSKTSMPSDAAESALASGDFARYSAEMNRREMAGTK